MNQEIKFPAVEYRLEVSTSSVSKISWVNKPHLLDEQPNDPVSRPRQLVIQHLFRHCYRQSNYFPSSLPESHEIALSSNSLIEHIADLETQVRVNRFGMVGDQLKYECVSEVIRT